MQHIVAEGRKRRGAQSVNGCIVRLLLKNRGSIGYTRSEGSDSRCNPGNAGAEGQRSQIYRLVLENCSENRLRVGWVNAQPITLNSLPEVILAHQSSPVGQSPFQGSE